jgi:hypothetical protein
MSYTNANLDYCQNIFSNLFRGLYFATPLSIRPMAVLQFLSVIAYDKNFLFRGGSVGELQLFVNKK